MFRRVSSTLREITGYINHMFEPNDVFESLVQGFLVNDFAIVDDFISPELMLQLYEILLSAKENNLMKQAGVGKESSFHENPDIRRDLIYWMEEQDADGPEKEFRQYLWLFIKYLNDTCYTGLNALECHYAWYAKDSFYKKHKDQFNADSGRKYSLITYLNPEWSAEDGGQLVLFHNDEEIVISPKGGRMVFFQSDIIAHEVLPTMKPRMSIAGWLKKN